MTTIEQRTDLVRGLLQSAYVIEHARASVQTQWGGGFDRDAARTTQRAGAVGELLDRRAFARPEDVIAPHRAWLESYVGAHATEVPLGAAVIHQLGKWSDRFASPFLGEDRDDFVALGREHTRVEAERRTMSEQEAFLVTGDLPSGRRFVILTDVHVGSPGRDGLARIAVREINEIGPEFVVIPGDFTEDGEPEQFRAAKEIFDGLACPYYVVMGNHDAVQRSTGEPNGARFYAGVFGSEPTDHVIDCGELQVALVDSTDPTPAGGGPSGGIDSGALRPGQAAALAARLDTRRPALVIQHHELQPFAGFPPVRFAMRDEDSAAELDALSAHNLVGVVAGHTHRSAALPAGDGSVTQLEVPALKDWPYAYSVAAVSEHGVRITVRQLADREAVWTMARRELPLIRRFATGGAWASLDYTFAL